MFYENLYFDSVKTVLDQAIESFANRTGQSISDIDRQISAHIEKTSHEHRNLDPNIDYNDPLCRLGYLFTHAGANATLFERGLKQSQTLSEFVDQRAGQSISLCTVGGGPGTELLGLIKYILIRQLAPTDIHFTVLDNVPEWGESWEFIADACRDLLQSEIQNCPIIHRAFYPMDVTDAQSYTTYGWLFGRLDTIIYNYLISENKIRLDKFENALYEMVQRVKCGCLFVVIDRLERNTTFRGNVTDLFSKSGLDILEEFELGGAMIDDESALGDYPQRFCRRPRRWFRTWFAHHPTAFVLVAQKPNLANFEL